MVKTMRFTNDKISMRNVVLKEVKEIEPGDIISLPYSPVAYLVGRVRVKETRQFDGTIQIFWGTNLFKFCNLSDEFVWHNPEKAKKKVAKCQRR